MSHSRFRFLYTRYIILSHLPPLSDDIFQRYSTKSYAIMSMIRSRLFIALSLLIVSVNAFTTYNAKSYDKSDALIVRSSVLRRQAVSEDSDDGMATERRGFFQKILGGAVATGIVANKIAIEGPSPYTPPKGLLKDKLIVITGGNTGLGLESAKRLAVGGATIVLTSRSVTKGAKAVSSVENYVPESAGRIFSLPLDLCDLSSVRAFPERLKNLLGDNAKVDVLLNNAGVMAIPELELTKDGYEKTFQTNHLGHFALTAQLFPMLANGARIVNVSSMAHLIVANGLDMNNLNGEVEYKPWDAYGRSKMENILFTKELQRRIDNAGLNLSTVALHPGAVRTDLARYLVGEDKYVSMDEQQQANYKFSPETLALLPLVYFTKAVDRGATSQVWLSSFEGNNVGGKFYQNCKEVQLVDSARDMGKAKQLWSVSEQMSGVKFEF